MPDGEHGFKLGEEALRVLEAIDVPVVPIAVCGKARTGKSYLLNSFLRRAPAVASELAGADLGGGTEERGAFPVGSTIESCTKGIWLHGRPIPALLGDGTRVAVLVLDTEGFGSTEREDAYDARVFALATLLASVLVYNSSGVVNNDAIASLSFVANMSRHIQARSGDESSSPDELAELFPSFVWVLRDFHLQLVDSDGETLSASDYMDQRLADDGALDRDSLRRNRVRAAIRTFFRRRECHTLMVPVEEEADLQRLEELGDAELRPGFVEGRDDLVRRLLTPPTMAPKLLRGVRVTGRMLAGLARAYVAAVNDGGVPSVGSAWEAVTDEQCRRAVEEAGRELSAALDASLATLPLSDEDEAAAAAGLREAARVAFDSRAVGGRGDVEKRRGEVDAAAAGAAARLRSKNEEEAARSCEALLGRLGETHVEPALARLRAAPGRAAAAVAAGGGADPAAEGAALLTSGDVDALAEAYGAAARGPASVVWRVAAEFWSALVVRAGEAAAASREGVAEATSSSLRSRARAAEAAATTAADNEAASRRRAEEAEAERDAAVASARRAKAEAEASSKGAAAARREAAAAREEAEGAEARAAEAERRAMEERSRRRRAEEDAAEAVAARESIAASAASEAAAARAEREAARASAAAPAPRGGGGGGAGSDSLVRTLGGAEAPPRGARAAAMRRPPLRAAGQPRLGAPDDADDIAAAASKDKAACCSVM